MASPEPSRDDLVAALSRLQQAGYLPGLRDLDHALAAPFPAALIRMHARLQLCGVVPFAPTRRRPVVQAPEPPHPADQPPAQPRAPRRRRTASARPTPAHSKAPTSPMAPSDLFSTKRAASGDRDDD